MATIEVSINVNDEEVRQMIEDFPDQLAWATTVAINNTLDDARTAEITRITKEFTIRSPHFLNNSLKILPRAKKSTLTGTMGLIDLTHSKGKTSDIFGKFEDGGTKTSIAGGKIAVPVDVKKTNRDLISTANRPRNLKNAFKVTAKDGAEYLMQKVGRGKKAVVKLAYVLSPSVQIHPLLHFEETTTKVVNDKWDSNFSDAYEKAIATRKPTGE